MVTFKHLTDPVGYSGCNKAFIFSSSYFLKTFIFCSNTGCELGALLLFYVLRRLSKGFVIHRMVRRVSRGYVKHHVLDWCNVPNRIIKRHGLDLHGVCRMWLSPLCVCLLIETRCFV